MRTTQQIQNYLLKMAKSCDLEPYPNEQIQNGDTYLAYTNDGGIQLLTAKSVEESFIIPTSDAYCFDKYRCLKVKI